LRRLDRRCFCVCKTSSNELCSRSFDTNTVTYTYVDNIKRIKR